MKKCLFAGSFDPITLGHLNIIEHVSVLFDTVIIAVAEGKGNSVKRLELVKRAVCDIKNVTAEVFDGMLTSYANSKNGTTLIRGLRNTVDFEYEKSLAAAYRSQDKNLQILYIISPPELCHVSSTTVREIAGYGGDLTGYVPKSVQNEISSYYKK